MYRINFLINLFTMDESPKKRNWLKLVLDVLKVVAGFLLGSSDIII